MTRCLIRAPTTGWASVGFDPHEEEDVGALDVVEGVGAAGEAEARRRRPAAEGAWQTRAQLSTLLVPTATRISFCIR